jgi:hypothetical protein
VERLTTTRDNYAQQLEELSDPTKRRPNYSIGGRSVQWQQYMGWLRSEIRELDRQIAEQSGDEGGISATAIQ